ncbi:MAG: glycosyltransferase family 39 protein, partial [bacterium]
MKNHEVKKTKIPALLLILILAAAIRLYRAGEPFDGFHGFNEAWYSIIAQNFSVKTLLYPTAYTGEVDYNVPPLLSYVLFVVFRTFGASEFMARLVPIFFGILGVYFVFLIGVKLYNERIALASAAMLAFMPVSIIVGRNVQADSLFVGFILAFLYFYLKGRSSSKPAHHIIAGLFLGLAIFSKQPAVLVIVIIFLWEITTARNLRFLNRYFIIMLTAAAAVLLPFYGFHLIVNPAALIDAQHGGALRLSELPDVSLLGFLLRESVWAISPPIALIFLISLIYFIRRANDGDLLLYISIAVYGIFFLFLHKHTYYMLPIAPFAALLAGRLWSGEKYQSGKTVMLTIVCIAAALVSIFLLCGMKFG